MTPELESAIANATRVFARYALNGRIIVTGQLFSQAEGLVARNA